MARPKKLNKGDGTCGLWCNEYYPEGTCGFCTFQRDEFGQDGADRLGNVGGCGLGCIACDDEPGDWFTYGVSNLGRRFLLPYLPPTEFDVPLQNRDAWGLIHDLRSNQPHLIPRTIVYQRGTTFTNFSVECIEGACSRLPPPSTTSPCSGGVGSHEPIQGFIPDCFGYQGYDFPTDSIDFWCRNIQNSSIPQTVHIHANPLFQTSFVRSGGRVGTQVIPHCTSNKLIGCTSKVKAGDCPASYAFIHEPTPPYYNDDESRQYFNFLRIEHNSAQLWSDPTRIVDNPGQRHIKNAVLDHIAKKQFPGWTVSDNGNQVNAREVNFQQIDRRNPDDYNAIFFRSWNDPHNPNARAPSDVLPVVEGLDLSKSHLYHSGHKVEVELVILYAAMRMSVVAHTVRHQTTHGTPAVERVYPHIRCRIWAYTAIRAKLPNKKPPHQGEPYYLEQPWLPVALGGKPPADGFIEVTIPERPDLYDGPTPTVEPAIDRIVYVVTKDGVDYPVELPSFVEWWGALGSFSQPRTFDINQNPVTNGANHCTRLAERFKSVPIPGWYDLVDSHPHNPAKFYTGQLIVSFPS